MFSTTDVFLIGLIVFLMFGPKKLPELARGMGLAMKEFKKAQSDVEDNFRTAVQDEERKKAAAANTAGNAPLASPQPAQTRPPEKL